LAVIAAVFAGLSSILQMMDGQHFNHLFKAFADVAQR
jgi:hypothetical protein